MIAFDKTGTLTEGKPSVTAFEAVDVPHDDALALAAAVQRQSDHPLARAVVAAHDADLAARGGAVPSPVAADAVRWPDAAWKRVGGQLLALGSTRWRASSASRRRPRSTHARRLERAATRSRG